MTPDAALAWSGRGAAHGALLALPAARMAMVDPALGLGVAVAAAWTVPAAARRIPGGAL